MYMFFFSLIPATILVTLGYFVMFAAGKAQGGAQTFGKYLSFWIFIIAALMVLGSALAPAMGWGPRHSDRMGRYMQQMNKMPQMQQPDQSPQNQMQ